MTGYSEDLAFIHDEGFGDVARAAAGVLVEMLRARQIRAGLVVDLGCGSGIAAQAFLRAGYQVLGIDISRSMIRLARRQVPGARFVTGSLLRAKLPRCDAVAAIGEAVNYCFDPANGKTKVVRFFRRVYDALRPGGVFLFDVAEPGQMLAGSQTSRHVMGNGWAVLADSIEDKPRRMLLRRIVSFRRIGRLYRRTEESHSVRLYPAAELAAELRRIGFRVRVRRRYGGLDLRRGHAAVMATKP